MPTQDSQCNKWIHERETVELVWRPRLQPVPKTNFGFKFDMYSDVQKRWVDPLYVARGSCGPASRGPQVVKSNKEEYLWGQELCEHWTCFFDVPISPPIELILRFNRRPTNHWRYSSQLRNIQNKRPVQCQIEHFPANMLPFCPEKVKSQNISY